MPSITFFYGAYCFGEEIAQDVAKTLQYEIVTDQALIADASRRFDMPEDRFQRAISGKTSVFNNFTHERERCIAYLKAVMAEALRQDNRLYLGFAGHTVPREISHVLRVCTIASTPFRIRQAMAQDVPLEKEATRIIHADDVERTRWTAYLREKNPWDPSLYDIVIPVDNKDISDVVALICRHARKDILQPTEKSQRAVEDFRIAAQVEVALVKEGHGIGVSVNEGRVLLTINKHVIMLSRLEEELKAIAGRVEGVSEVETKVGPGFYETDIYRQYDFRTPSRVLLVDDERQFVETLSERLLMREVGSAFVYNGEQALTFVKEEEPEVMILDLKMPGIDGMEVLRRVKKTNPDIEVIILTGHGSKKDQETCMQLGAFAYLEKPVDIEVLTKTLRAAYDKVGRHEKAEPR